MADAPDDALQERLDRARARVRDQARAVQTQRRRMREQGAARSARVAARVPTASPGVCPPYPPDETAAPGPG